MRRPRLDVAGVPMHIVHRGVDRARVFHDDADRQQYLLDLGRCSRAAGLRIHGYVLMDNHVHLLVSADNEGAAATTMQSLGARFVRRMNLRYARTGPLWEGRFRSFLIDSDRYLLSCLAYIELNPVRAGMVSEAWEHPWSSVHHHLGACHDRLVSPHPTFVALAGSREDRAEAWRLALGLPLPATLIADLRHQSKVERALGGDAFVARLEAHSGAMLREPRRGRPRSTARS
jgi:putative transposase